MPSHKSTKNPLTLASASNAELMAGAHSFGYGALQVAPLPLFLPEDYPTCQPNDYYSETEFKFATADCNQPKIYCKLVNLVYNLHFPFCRLVVVWEAGGLPLVNYAALCPNLLHR